VTSAKPEPGDLPAVTLHTDGGCQGNPGIGGWACVLESGDRRREHSGGELATTNNRMELMAAIAAFRLLKRPCRVDAFTDSDYLRQGITGWVAGWKRNGWKTRNREPVKNQDLWRELDAVSAPHRVQWHWLKGHAGHAGNERCDELAGAAMERIRRENSPERLRAALKEFLADPTRGGGTPPDSGTGIPRPKGDGMARG